MQVGSSDRTLRLNAACVSVKRAVTARPNPNSILGDEEVDLCNFTLRFLKLITEEISVWGIEVH